MKKHLCFKVLCLFFAALCANQALAAGATTNRAHTTEMYLVITQWAADTVTIPNLTLPTQPGPIPAPATSDLNFDFHNTVMFGFGGGYNFSDHLMLRGDFAFGSPDYEMKWNGARITGEAWINTGKVNLDFNLLKNRPFTPFISAGVGYMYIDTGIPSGPPSYSIWWDYYWGPVVVGTQPTHSDTFFTYNALIGIRWDIAENYVLRASYGTTWVDARRGTQETYEAALSFSWKY
jgi:opacity protein-like surface antigen